MQSSYAQVTPIDALPELEDLEGMGNAGGSPLPEDDPNAEHIKRAGRMIRNSVRMPPPEAGMAPNSQRMNIRLEGSHEQRSHPSPPVRAPVGYPQEEYPNEVSPLQGEGGLTKYAMPSGGPSCLEVAEHVANCPICSKLYNNDKTIYIIAIAILSVICILLLKKVLDV